MADVWDVVPSQVGFGGWFWGTNQGVGCRGEPVCSHDEDRFGGDRGADRGEAEWASEILEHIGSARDEVELAVLKSVARQRLHGVQEDQLPLGTSSGSGPVVEHTASEVLWRTVCSKTS